MGHASGIALEIAKQYPDRKTYLFDGDGALLMHMGTLATIGHYAPKNLIHVVFDNGCHESTGGQPTVSESIDLSTIALGANYKQTFVCYNPGDIAKALKKMDKGQGPGMIIVKVKPGSRKDLGRPKLTPVEMKESFMKGNGL